MKLEMLAGQYSADSRIKALDKAVGTKGVSAVKLYNAAGSAVAVALSSLRKRSVPMLVVGDSVDDAGYLYHDLSRLV